MRIRNRVTGSLSLPGISAEVLVSVVYRHTSYTYIGVESMVGIQAVLTGTELLHGLGFEITLWDTYPRFPVERGLRPCFNVFFRVKCDSPGPH